MKLTSLLLGYALSSSGITYADHHYLHQHDSQQTLSVNFGTQTQAKRVAIIGAGAGGTSAAYHLRKYSDAAGVPLNVTIFERNSFIGGRSTTVHAYNVSTQPVELGASIFVELNHVLVDAAKELGLETIEPHGSGDDEQIEGEELGIWNGEEFILRIKNNVGWWDQAKLVWRYGYSIFRTRALVKKVVGMFLQMYEAPNFPFTSLSEVAYRLGLTAVTAATGEQYLKENQISSAYANEIIQASTRVNYAANLGLIHGLEAIVCMATDGAMAIKDGNWQIFSGMAKAATHDIRLNTSVTSLHKQEDGTYTLRSKPVENPAAARPASDTFDAVIIAAPFQFMDLSIDPPPKHLPAKVPYVQLHVTLFTSPHPLHPLAFNLKQGEKVPETALTTLQPNENYGSKPAVGKAGFYSISTLRVIRNPETGAKEFLYKIFSPDEISDRELERLLGAEDAVSWIYRKLWNSYPYEYPRVTFEEIRLDGEGGGLWYTSGMDSFISTMETNALMGKNIARLIVDGWEEDDAEREHMLEVKEQI